jgi:hypothetical protein
VVKDGVRFLTVILRAAVAHRPSRPLLLGAGLLGLASLLVALQPVTYWLSHGELREPMIYRVMLASLLGTLSALVVCSALVAEKLAALIHRRPLASKGITGQLGRLLSRGRRRWSIAALVLAAFVSSWPGMVQYVTTGHVAMHWSRAMLSSLLVVVAAMLGITSFWMHMLELIATQQLDPRAVTRAPDRIRPGKAAR